MGLVSGMLSASRFAVVTRPREPDFDALAFEPLPPGSERRESAGFAPLEPDAPYQIGPDRFAFRLRFDRVRPDPAAVAERTRALERAEAAAAGLERIAGRRRRELQALAEEEIARATPPRTHFVEGVLDGERLYLATTARARIGSCLALLRAVGVEAHPQAPWLEAGAEPEPLPGVRFAEPGASAHGCRFLRALIEQGEAMAEPIAGAARVALAEVEVSLKGAVHVELFRLFEQGGEPLSAKLVAEQGVFRFDAPTFRIASLRAPAPPAGHWTERLDARLENLVALYEWLDAAYSRLGAGSEGGAPAAAEAEISARASGA